MSSALASAKVAPSGPLETLQVKVSVFDGRPSSVTVAFSATEFAGSLMVVLAPASTTGAVFAGGGGGGGGLDSPPPEPPQAESVTSRANDAICRK